MSLDRYGRLEMGRYELASSGSNVGFFSSGRTRVCLSCTGKTPPDTLRLASKSEISFYLNAESDSDPVPTWFLKMCFSLVPTVSDNINPSFIYDDFNPIVMICKGILCNVCICRLATTMIGCSACRCTGCGTQSESSWAGHN